MDINKLFSVPEDHQLFVFAVLVFLGLMKLVTALLGRDKEKRGSDDS